jgi:DNA polymerase
MHFEVVMAHGMTVEALLELYLAVGIDEFVSDEMVNRFASEPPPAGVADKPPIIAPPRAVVRASPPVMQPDAVIAARRAAAAAQTLAELRQAVCDFTLCSLKNTATNTVFADGNPAAGIDRTSCYITNVLFWRPPGNRKPTDSEIALCRPFVHRHIALVRPAVLVMVGGTASGALMPGSEGITRCRGRWFGLEIEGIAAPIPSIAMYHPSFLLRSPERKRESWLDLLSIKEKLVNAAS